MKKVLIVFVALVGAYYAVEQSPQAPHRFQTSQATNGALDKAIAERGTGRQVQGTGTVRRILSDDNDGSRHQRFIVELESGRTLLVAHNIDVAPRVNGLAPGDSVSFFGEYEWNDRGGIIHWTHHDPRARHVDGWIDHDGKRYK